MTPAAPRICACQTYTRAARGAVGVGAAGRAPAPDGPPLSGPAEADVPRARGHTSDTLQRRYACHAMAA